MSGNHTHSTTFQIIDLVEKEVLIIQLKARGGQEQLVMFLTGFVRAGKNACVKIAQRFCFKFCCAVYIPWDDNTFIFTATTGSAASLFGGQTMHDAVSLNTAEKNISNKKRQEWQTVRILIINEISFFTRVSLANLNLRLKNMMGRQDLPFGGVSIVFSGKFHQLKTVCCEKEDELYNSRLNGFSE